MSAESRQRLIERHVAEALELERAGDLAWAYAALLSAAAEVEELEAIVWGRVLSRALQLRGDITAEIERQRGQS